MTCSPNRALRWRAAILKWSSLGWVTDFVWVRCLPIPLTHLVEMRLITLGYCTLQKMNLAFLHRPRRFRPTTLTNDVVLRYVWLKIIKPRLSAPDRLCYKKAKFGEFEQRDLMARWLNRTCRALRRSQPDFLECTGTSFPQTARKWRKIATLQSLARRRPIVVLFMSSSSMRSSTVR